MLKELKSEPMLDTILKRKTKWIQYSGRLLRDALQNTKITLHKDY